MDAINKLGLQAFIKKVGNVVEKSPECAASVYWRKPFASFDDLYWAFCSFIDALPEYGKKRILNRNAEIGAPWEKLGVESRLEQGQSGVRMITPEMDAILRMLNKLYRTKFGYPFVLCARINTKDTIIDAMESRLENSKSTELKMSIDEVKKIMFLRLKDAVFKPKSSI